MLVDQRAALRRVVHANVLLWRTYRLFCRLRWLTKLRFVLSAGRPTRDHLGFILWDPEVESHSYRLANGSELAEIVARAFELPLSDVRGWIDEARSDPELTTRLWRRTRRKPWLKSRPEIGDRLLWYLLVRHLQPSLIVETGIYDGLGSLVLLRALARNADEGHQGKLLSIDNCALSGELVPEELQDNWEKVVGATDECLEPAIAGDRIGLFVQDTPHTVDNQRSEFGIALRYAASTIVLVDGSGGYCPVLQQLADHYELERHEFTPIPVDHPVGHQRRAFLVARAEGLGRPLPWARPRHEHAGRH